MAGHNVALFAVRALILVRDSESKSLTGNAIISNLKQLSGYNSHSTGLLADSTGSIVESIQKAIDLLVKCGLFQAHHASAGAQPVSWDSYQTLRSKGAIQAIKFSITEKLSVVQEALGLHSLTELEHRAMGNTINIQPLFGQVQTGLFRRRSIFVAMPFAENLKPVYDISIVPSVKDVGLKAIRADDIFSGNSIMNKVWNAIYTSYAIIVDCSGRNANVFYELGMAQTIGKTCLIIAQSKDDIPFDITQFEYVIYENTTHGLAQLKSKLTTKLRTMVQEFPPFL